jgi:hypothetical protein
MEASHFPSLDDPLHGAPREKTPETLAPDTSHLSLPKSQLASTAPTFPEGGLRAWATVAGASVFRFLWH